MACPQRALSGRRSVFASMRSFLPTAGLEKPGLLQTVEKTKLITKKQCTLIC